MSISLALSIFVLFISLMQSVNRAEFLIIIFFLLFEYCFFDWDCSHYKYIYASLQSHNPDFNIEVLNLIWLLVLYVPCVPSFISTQFFVLNLVSWFGVLSNKFIIFWFFDFSLLYYYINIKIIKNFLSFLIDFGY